MDPSPNPDGSGAEAVSPPSARAIHPAWSADSRRVIYCTDDDLQPLRKNDSDIDAVDLATGKVTTLITGGVNTYPAWSRDMRHTQCAQPNQPSGFRRLACVVAGRKSDCVRIQQKPPLSDFRDGPRRQHCATLYFTNCTAKDYGTDCEILVSRLPM